MANIKPLDIATEKWVRRATVAGPDYTLGVQNPKKAWDQACKEAEKAYQQAVITAAQQGRYGKGIAKAGMSKWQEGAIKKGPTRFTEGVNLARDNWKTGFEPYAKVIQSVSLPERGPKGDPRNLQRVAAIATALRAAKEKLA